MGTLVERGRKVWKELGTLVEGVEGERDRRNWGHWWKRRGGRNWEHGGGGKRWK